MRQKIFIFFLVFFITISFSNTSSAKNSPLVQADSLFRVNQRTEAIAAYRSILDNGSFSPALFLKLAYMQETSGDISGALVTLNTLYKINPDPDIHLKMEELALINNLSGYQYTDSQYFNTLYQKYYYYILLSALIVSGFYFAHLNLKKVKGNNLGMRPLLFICILLVLFYIVNFNIQPLHAVIVNKNTLIMSAPSPGSDLLEITGSGHRVSLIDQTDIWYQVEFNDKTGYIKASDLYIIRQE